MSERNGPEFAPLRDYVKEYSILVLVKNDKGEEVRRVPMNYGDPKDRIWLGKLSFWAWEQGYKVETTKA